ncbi:hydrophobin [Trichoderma barbatum]
MKFFAVAALFAASALAAPAGEEGCPGGLTHGIALCCATNVLGLATLDCGRPTSPVRTPEAFQAHCASKGKQAICCSVPVASLGLLCEKPSGIP